MYRAPSGALRVRRRHRAVGLGPRRPEPRRQPAGPQHAAGDGEPARRHGRAAGDAAVRASSPRRRRPTPRRRRRRSPRPPAAVADGTQVTITGTASDTGGGVVAGVEVSTDGGTHLASRRPARRAGPTPGSRTARPSTTIKVARDRRQRQPRAPRAPARPSTSTARARSGATTSRRRHADAGDPSSVEVGVKFTSDKLRHGHRHALLQGRGQHRHPHRQPVDARTGTRLAQATFTGETASGWQTVTFARRSRSSRARPTSPPTSRPTATTRPRTDYFYRAPAPGPERRRARSTARRCTRSATPGTTRQRRLQLRRGEHVPDQHLQRRQLLGRRHLRADAGARARSPTSTAAAGGRTSANVTWTAPATGGAPTSYKITPYIGATAQTPTTVTGTPPATTTTVTGLTNGTTYTFTVQAINPNGTGRRRRSRTRSRRSTPVAPVGADRTSPRSRPRSPRWSVDRAGQRRRQPDHGLHRHAVHRRDRADAGPGRRASATSATVTGLTNGTAYTFKVTRDQRRRHQPRLGRRRTRSTPQATMFDFATPDDRRLAATPARSSSA